MRLLLVDDHEIVRSGLKRLVENYPEINIVGECSSGEEAYNFVRKTQVDFVVMDLSMPGKGGIETTKQIRKHFEDIKILILSMHDNPTLIKQSLDAGANGFILKNDISDDLIKGILSGKVKIEIINDGIVKKAISSSGMGLSGIRERVAQMKGQIHISSSKFFKIIIFLKHSKK